MSRIHLLATGETALCGRKLSFAASYRVDLVTFMNERKRCGNCAAKLRARERVSLHAMNVDRVKRRGRR